MTHQTKIRPAAASRCRFTPNAAPSACAHFAGISKYRRQEKRLGDLRRRNAGNVVMNVMACRGTRHRRGASCAAIARRASASCHRLDLVFSAVGKPADSSSNASRMGREIIMAQVWKRQTANSCAARALRQACRQGDVVEAAATSDVVARETRYHGACILSSCALRHYAMRRLAPPALACC